MKTRGVVIVTRVSTGEQVKHGTSLESQLDACRTKALGLGLPIVAEYEDAGISGAFLATREGMQAALADIREGRADTLICASLSRFSRDTEHQQRIKKDVRAAGGRIVFCDMHFEETPEGDLAFNIMGGFAEYERGVIWTRTMKGRASRVDAGQQPQRARSPYGYHIVTHADVTRGAHTVEMLGKYMIVEVEADAIRHVFESDASGAELLNSVCRRLREMGARPPRGEFWRASTVRGVFVNPVYKGEPASGRFRVKTDESRVGQFGQGAHKIVSARAITRVEPDEWRILSAPAIVSPQTWQAVQERLSGNQGRKSGNPHRANLLASLAMCPSCGAKMTTRGEPRKYVCSRYNNALLQMGERHCGPHSVSVTLVESAVLNAVLDAAERPEAMEQAEAYYLEQARAKEPVDVQGEMEAVEKKLADLVMEEGATVAAQVAGIRAGASPDAYASAFAGIAARRAALEDRRKVPSATVAGKPTSGVGGSSDWHRRALEAACRALTSDLIEGREKRNLIQCIVHKVVCLPDGADVYFYGSDTLQNIRTIRPFSWTWATVSAPLPV